MGSKGKEMIVISVCLNRVVTVEKWLLKLFAVSDALSEEEGCGYSRLEKTRRTTEARRRNDWDKLFKLGRKKRG